ncbi:DNA-deoxyinosine glycosylase [uncultured Comamonas sp.]|uniref:DNA-deoxyinosine glycosylase n=1 Tax=uncultured Comamonas sp. TaxID=114710 RepID=UPI003749E4D3
MADALLCGLAPVVGPDTKVLILGSFPGVQSLQLQQYYAHPRNHMWPLLAALWPKHPQPSTYAGRCAWLLERGLGLWDVYAACEREGSLDTSIRNAQLNDFGALKKQCPQLVAAAHNGGESFRHAARVQAVLGLPSYRLPSSSPANASWSFERKLAGWRDVMRQSGLLA